MPMERIHGILKRLFEGGPLAPALAGMRAIDLWPEVVGPEAARRTRAVSFREKCLTVEVSSSAWMNQLTFLKAEVLSRLSQAVGPGVVTDVRFIMAGRHEPGLGGSAPGAPSRGTGSEQVQGEDPADRTRLKENRGRE